jgi:hypothetical protein
MSENFLNSRLSHADLNLPELVNRNRVGGNKRDGAAYQYQNERENDEDFAFHAACLDAEQPILSRERIGILASMKRR